jgi:hypothetical protein
MRNCQQIENLNQKRKNSKPIPMVQVVVYFYKIVGFSEMVDIGQF